MKCLLALVVGSIAENAHHEYDSLLQATSIDFTAITAKDSTRASTPYIDTGSAGDFCILTKTGVTTTGITVVKGDMGTSPIAATALTGFALNLQAGDSYSTSGIVTGKVYAADYPTTTPAKMTRAILDMEAAYTSANGAAPPDTTEKGGGILSGMVLKSGIHKWSSTVKFATTLTFDGSSSDRWIMQIAQTFTVGPGAKMLLTGGAKWENIFWAIGGVVAFDDGSHGEGTFLAKTMISFKAGSSLNGAALAQTQVTLIATTINGDATTPPPPPPPPPPPTPVWTVKHTHGACYGVYFPLPSGVLNNLDACQQACDGGQRCRFVSFCPSGTDGCQGPHVNQCALYSTCTSKDDRSAHRGYTSYVKP